MKAKKIFFLLMFISSSLFAQENKSVLWDFGLRNSFKWFNGKTVNLSNPKTGLTIVAHPHFDHPTIAAVFNFYPRLLDLAFETSFEYNQFSGIIRTKNSGIIEGTDYQRNIFAVRENVKYVVSFTRNNIDYVLQPFVGLGIGFIPTGPDFNITPAILNDANVDPSIAQPYSNGVVPIHNTTSKFSSVMLATSLGADIEFRFGHFGIAARLAYDLGLNNFYTQDIEYRYYQMDMNPDGSPNGNPKTEKVTLKYYDSGFNLGISLKYLFRN